MKLFEIKFQASSETIEFSENELKLFDDLLNSMNITIHKRILYASQKDQERQSFDLYSDESLKWYVISVARKEDGSGIRFFDHRQAVDLLWNIENNS